MQETRSENLSHCLYLNFQKIFRCLNFGRSMQGKNPPITGQQMRILSFFNESNVVHISEMSRILGMSLQSVNNLVRRLEATGYVQKSTNENDKRFSDIMLTAKGKKQIAVTRDDQVEILKTILDKMDPAETKLLDAVIENAAIILEKASLHS